MSTYKRLLFSKTRVRQSKVESILRRNVEKENNKTPLNLECEIINSEMLHVLSM